MHRKNDILILQRSKELPPKLRERLRLANYAAKTIFDIRMLRSTLAQAYQPIILIDCSGTAAGAQRSIKDLIELPEICDYPLIFIAENVENFAESIDRYFLLARRLLAPTEATQVISTINEIHNTYHSYLERLALVAPDTCRRLQQQIQGSTQPLIEPKHGATRPPASRSELETGDELIANIFEILETLYKENITLNGQQYSHQIDEAFLAQQQLLPRHPVLREASKTVCKKLNKIDQKHLYRTAFIMGNSTRVLRIGANLQDYSAAASFLFASAFTKQTQHLLRLDYLRSKSESLRHEIGEKIIASAEQLDASFNEELKDIIRKTGVLIAQLKELEDTPTSLAASILMASDLTDRICFHSGFWDPHAAHRLLFSIKHGRLANIDTRVIACISKLLSETISSQTPAHLIPQQIRTDVTLQKQDNEPKDPLLSSHQHQIELSQLKPGMRLASPLVGYDGLLLLGADLVLDPDMIWRIWQLASIRPLRSPLVVVAS